MLKSRIKKFLVDRKDRQYRNELREQRYSYHNWYKMHKRELSESLRQKDHMREQSTAWRRCAILI